MAVIAKQRYKLDIAPKGGWVIVYASQHDDGAREIEFEITNQGNAFSIPASINVSVQGIKANKSYFSHSCSYSGNVVTMALADDMTDVIGKAICVLKFTNSSQQKLATAKFILNVDSDSSSEGVIIDTEAEEIFNQMLNEIRAQASAISADIVGLQSMVGTPLVASTASAMTNHNKIYVYTGSESGYTNGNWYYWNGSAWTSGGVYNAVAINIDSIPTQGSNNAVKSGGVYEQIEGINTRILDDIKKTYSIPFEPIFNVISGGLRANGTDLDNNSARARTQFIPIEAGKTYYIHLDTTTYTYIGAFLYSTNSQTSATRSFADGLLGSQDIIFTAGDNENYFRVGFKNATDGSVEITEENRTTIHDALKIYISDIDKIKEDVKGYADYINGLVDYPTINWEAFPQTSRDAYVLSWRTGFWGNSNTATNSDTAGAIRYWSWIGKQLEAIGTNYVEFIPPAEGHIILKEFETKTSTELLGRYEISEPTIIKLHDTHIYRIYVLGLTGDIYSYLTEEFINSIGIKPIYSVKYNNKAIRTDEFVRFTVKVNNTWEHDTATDTEDHESGEEHDHLCILTLPESYTTNGAKTPLIMYCHGASCGITENSWYGNGTGEGTAGNFLSMIRTFTAQGYAIFDVNNTRQVSSGFYDWGCLPLMSAYIKAWEYIKEKYNVSDKLYILSASMGTPAALNMMKWYKGDILASLILAPRPVSGKGRWSSIYEVSSDEKIKEILVSWGFEPDSILEDESYVIPSKESVFTAEVDAKLRGFYHYENMVTIDGTDYIFEKFPPTKVMVGTSDTPFLPEVREYFSALQNFGNYINYREVAGQSHGAMCTLVNGDLRSEGLAWFERFRYTESS